MDETKFRETEAKYSELQEKHSNGELSTNQMKEELKRLMVQDETGSYWMLGGKTGKWYKHDGTQWQESDPYEGIESPVEVLTEPIKEEEEYPVEEEEVISSGEPISSGEEVQVSSGEEFYSPAREEPVSTGGELFAPGEEESVPSSDEFASSVEKEPVSPGEELFSSAEEESVLSGGEFSSPGDQQFVSYETETERVSGAEDGVLPETKKYPTTGRESAQEEEKDEEEAFTVDIGAGGEMDTLDNIRCKVCESDNSPTAETCIFCGASLKEVEGAGQKESDGIFETAAAVSPVPESEKSKKKKKKKEKVKEIEIEKEEGIEEELLVKSIKITSFIFFLGGLGLLFGVLFGAGFGVFKRFLLNLSYELPIMLQEVRGGVAGGLIFAAIGGIGGFIISAILSLILSSLYNLIAFVFGGIRFKVKR